MTTTEEKTRENRLRRAAKRRGLELVKAITPPQGEPGWLLVDPDSGKIVSGLLLMSIEDIAVFLDDDPHQ